MSTSPSRGPSNSSFDQIAAQAYDTLASVASSAAASLSAAGNFLGRRITWIASSLSSLRFSEYLPTFSFPLNPFFGYSGAANDEEDSSNESTTNNTAATTTSVQESTSLVVSSSPRDGVLPSENDNTSKNRSRSSSYDSAASTDTASSSSVEEQEIESNDFRVSDFSTHHQPEVANNKNTFDSQKTPNQLVSEAIEKKLEETYEGLGKYYDHFANKYIEAVVAVQKLKSADATKNQNLDLARLRTKIEENESQRLKPKTKKEFDVIRRELEEFSKNVEKFVQEVAKEKAAQEDSQKGNSDYALLTQRTQETTQQLTRGVQEAATQAAGVLSHGWNRMVATTQSIISKSSKSESSKKRGILNEQLEDDKQLEDENTEPLNTSTSRPQQDDDQIPAIIEQVGISSVDTNHQSGKKETIPFLPDLPKFSDGELRQLRESIGRIVRLQVGEPIQEQYPQLSHFVWVSYFQ